MSGLVCFADGHNNSWQNGSGQMTIQVVQVLVPCINLDTLETHLDALDFGKRPSDILMIMGHANAQHTHTPAMLLHGPCYFMDMLSEEVLSSFQASCHRFESDVGLTWV